MALANNPFGFRPSRHLKGGEIRLSSIYTIASAYGTSIYTGDLVKTTGTSNNVQAAAAGDSFIGIFWGCQYTAADGSYKYSKYWPASTSILSGSTTIAYIYDDPSILYLAQSAAGALVDLHDACNMNAGAGGSTTTGISAEYADVVNTGVATQFMFYGFPKVPEYNSSNTYELNAAGTYSIVELYPMNHELAGTTPGKFV